MNETASRHLMNYTIPGLSESVCRQTFAFVNGFPANHLKKLAEQLAQSKHGEVVIETKRKWSDGHYHGIDLLDTAKIARDNLGPLGFGGGLRVYELL
jgi:hypothetical protein